MVEAVEAREVVVFIPTEAQLDASNYRDIDFNKYNELELEPVHRP